MWTKRSLLAACAVLGAVEGLAGAPAAAAAQATGTSAADCNRHCLLSILTTYTEALVDNDTARLAVSPELRVASNGVVTRPCSTAP